LAGTESSLQRSEMCSTADPHHRRRRRRNGSHYDRSGEAQLPRKGNVKIMRQDEIDQAAAYYDTHDMSHLMERGELDTKVTAEVTEVVSVRLPGTVMDAIRSVAKAQGVRPSNLMREWLEERLTSEGVDLEATVPVSALLAFVAEQGTRSRQERKR
jgi:hypothetical protein